MGTYFKEYIDEKVDEEIEKRYPFKLWFLFEVQAVTKEVALKAMEDHMNKMGKEEGIRIKKYIIEDAQEIEAPPRLKERKIDKIFSVISEAIVLCNSLSNALNIVMNYAPSSIEVLSPEKYEINMQDIQETLNAIADFMHKILSAGMGGVVLKV